MFLNSTKLFHTFSFTFINGKFETITSFNQFSRNINFISSNTSTILNKDATASSLIQSYIFSMVKAARVTGLLCSKPIYSHNNNKVTIQVFYYVSSLSNDTFIFTKDNNTTSLSTLSDSLRSLYSKEISLVFIRIHYPYLNSYIFAQYLAHNASSNTFVHFQDSILSYPSRNASELPAYISGIKIEVSGRLLTEAVVPRITKKVRQFGTAAGGIVDYAKFTTKNYLGAFTIKVWIMQRVRTLTSPFF